MSAVRNFAEAEVGPAMTPPSVKLLGKDKETQHTTTHPPEAELEPPHGIEDDKSVLTSCTQDDQDKASLRLKATADGWQNMMTPATTTAMSMTSLGDFSAPTVTDGGCPSGEPSEPLGDESERADGSNEAIVSCSDIDADLLLHIQYQNATTETSAPVLSLRVSSTVLRMASPPLRLLLDAPPVSRSRTSAGLHHLIAIHEPRVWGRREGRGTVSLILTAPNQSEQLRQAALIVFNILHHNKNYRPTEAPSMLQVAWVAELAWVLDCLRTSSIDSWIQSRVAGCVTVDPDTRLASALVLGFAMGDGDTFEQASLYCVLRGRKCDFDKYNGSSLGIVTVIHDALQRKRQEVAQALIDILDESLQSYCGHGEHAGNFDQTFIFGALFSAICNSSTGVTIAPMLGPAPHSGPSFRLQWQPQMNEESINSLMGKLVAIMETFNASLQLHRRDLSSQWKNPVSPIVAKVVKLRENLLGLNLEDYRPEMGEMMDVKICLGDVARETESEFQQLKIYSAPAIDDLKWTWRMMFYFLACFQLVLTLMEILVEGRWLRPVGLLGLFVVAFVISVGAETTTL